MKPASLSSVRTDETGSGPIPELDGVRGLAILLVLLFHFQGTRPSGFPKALTYPMILGWSGVDLFFVLSGFLITRILIRTRGASNYFAAFYARRALRILPLYLLAVLICFRVFLPLAESRGALVADKFALEPWFWLHVSNWATAFGRDMPPVSHFWSLAIEEQFYAVWPVLVLLTPLRRLPAVCAAIAVASAGMRCAAAAAGAPPEALHRLTIFRLDGLAIGGLAAALAALPERRAALTRRLRPLAIGTSAALAALLVSGRSAISPAMTRLGYTAFALVYGCLVFGAFAQAGAPSGLARWLRLSALRTLGKYSYGIYVVHYPIALLQRWFLAEHASALEAPAGTLVWLLSIVAGIAASFLVALVSWNLYEKRFLAWKRLFVARSSEAPP